MTDSLRCEEVREELPAFARDRDESLSVRRHLSRCPECRAELARYEQLLVALDGLRPATIEPPAGLKANLISIPESLGTVDTVRSHVMRNRRLYAGGAALAAAGAAALLVRHRRVATA
ncbi:MAG: hypothetical protein M3290_12935 [Actinomycetota bacterium]|nr:hypothetical protein [Actinomycetota bacterium]